MRRSHIGALALAVPLALSPTLASAATAAEPAPAPLLKVAQAPADQEIKGRYIVTLKPGADPAGLAREDKVKTRHLYRDVLNGFAADLSAAQLDELRRDSRVLSIEEDQKVAATATQTNAPWGLDRIDQRSGRNGTYTYNRNGAGVTAYIIDTGIDTAHADFGGRARNVFDAFGGNGQDCNGHGTHVAGTVGGSAYGVAKGVQLRGVRVLDCQGSGSFSGIIAGFDWVRQNAVRPAVANASLGGGYSAALNNAATALANSGVHLAVAAGNENQDACNVSPASASGTITVAASDSSDRKASFSNYGNCTDLYAPGVSITSARAGGGSTAMSGTSMASPHVSGVAALYKSAYGDASSATVNNWLVGNSTANVIGGNYSGTPNRLLFKSTL
ncbi:S8 family peptidase [Streptomyces fradiae]|uniref:Extracellular serine proteinase n=2 Tax=Streptomyces fradiae TaxID=1906 RepID=A0A1Y2NQW6_STRFR|nr:S8 family peptidase [Streptomyces fradiae]KAF0647736.1 peptidase S8 [Streptomyces fradiae ATCC 10745 = DSM 40063]KAF0650013.1 peptidase S8 [Streptomyces fradiae ATCC 10745 = DSM 40063]OSY49922.1 Extracellular serine proteinase precursor [Streptomyces fradiae ATCC 10745 = DSM 40063]QEV10731.1 S8 family peptidase [Streptomyces fradiae ATCC 10745 = DSM 40063]